MNNRTLDITTSIILIIVCYFLIRVERLNKNHQEYGIILNKDETIKLTDLKSKETFNISIDMLEETILKLEE